MAKAATTKRNKKKAGGKKSAAAPEGGADAAPKDESQAQAPEESSEAGKKPKPDKQEERLARLREKPPMSLKDRIAQSRETLKERLGPDEQFFEAPEGFIQIGPRKEGRMWCRYANGGQGGWINPMRNPPKAS